MTGIHRVGLFAVIAAMTLLSIFAEEKAVFLLSVLIFIGAYFSFRLAGQDISSAGVWLALGVWLYHFSIPILSQLGAYDENYPRELLRIPTLSIAVIFATIGVFERAGKFSNFARIRELRFSEVLYRFLLFSEMVYVFVNIFFLTGGKTEIALSGWARLQIVQALFVAAYAGVLVKKLVNVEPVRNFVIANSVFGIFAAMATGERDIFAGLTIVTAVCLLRFAIAGPITIGLGIFSGGILFTILQTLRNILSVEATYDEFTRGILVEFFAGEPRSAAQNFGIMIEHISSNGYLGIEYAINDFLSIFIPKSLFYIENSLNWFNNTYFPGVVAIGGGVGYSLIANIYSYGGEYLVYLFFCLFSYALIKFRNAAFRRPLYFAFLAACIPSIIYGLRGDVSVLVGGIARGVLPVFLFYYLARPVVFGKYSSH